MCLGDEDGHYTGSFFCIYLGQDLTDCMSFKEIFQILWNAHYSENKFSPHLGLSPKNLLFWNAEGFLEKSLLPRGARVAKNDLRILRVPINLIN